MRSLEQYKEEIFRRSEKRIKKRKQIQKYAITWCVVLVVCLGLTVGGINMRPRTKGSTNAKGEVADGKTENSYAVTVTLETRTADGFESKYMYLKEGQEVQQLYASIQSLYPDTSTGNSDNFGSHVGNSEKTVGHVITFRMSNGLEQKFSLSETVLTNENTKETVVLTEGQLTKLKQELSITE